MKKSIIGKRMQYVFDTTAILAFLEDERGAKTVHSLITDVEAEKAEGIVSPITLTELFYHYAKSIGEKEAYEIITQLKLSKIKVFSPGEEIAIKAGAYKLYGMPLADAIIAATAKILRAKLVADDKHYKELDIDLFKFR